MPLFQYEAKSIKGNVLRGKIEAIDENKVAAMLSSMDYYPLKIVPCNKFSNINLLNTERVSKKDIAIFCSQLSIVISSGISILNCLNIVMNQTKNKKLRETVRVISKDIQAGVSLSEAVKKHKNIFPDMFINMVSVGEVSGSFDIIMERLSDYYNNEYNLNQKLKQSLTYPIFVCIFAVFAITFLINNILPKFLSMIYQFDGVTLPLSTRIILKIHNFFNVKYILILIPAILVFSAILKNRDNIKINKLIDNTKFKIPIIGQLYKRELKAKFANILSVLIFSGIPISQGLIVCANAVGSYTARNIILDAVEKINNGMNLSEAFGDNKLFSGILIDMIKVGEETGNIGTLLSKTAEFYDLELNTTIGQVTSIIEPAIIILLALVIGFIMLSILMPLFQLYDYML